MNIKKMSRILSVILCLTIICSVAVQGVGFASAASVFEDANLLVDPGFETMDLAAAATDESGQWYKWQTVAKSEDARNGNYSVAMTPESSGKGCSLEQDIPGLQIGLTYTYSIWVKLGGAGSQAGEPSIGVKNQGGSSVESKVDVSNTEATDWKEYSVDFIYSDASKSPRVYVWIPNGGTTVTYVDDASLKVKGDIARAEISNGNISVQMSDSFTGTVSADDFSATYTSSANPGSTKELNLTGSAAEDGKSIDLKFDKIAPVSVEQTITVSLKYGSSFITLDFAVEASGSDIAVAMLDSISAENGSLKIKLTQAPTIAPQKSDFIFGLSVDGEEKEFNSSDFSFDADAKTVTVSFAKISAIPGKDRCVTVSVTYNGKTRFAFYTVVQGSASVYYVSSTDGDDENSGTSEAEPFKTIDKLNTIDFIPGDRILFKKGDTFTGTFKPKGSGADGAPIIVSSYGDSDERPVLQPGESWNGYIASGGANAQAAEYRGCILLDNIEYWEIRDLELKDPSYDPEFYKTADLTVYNAGIRVHNTNMGDLTHYVFDNLVIHGFRGPGTNLGKSSGGIQFNVDYDPNDRTSDKPSAFVDIAITNCEIYECGRSGVNFLNVWASRRATGDSKWSSTNYGTLTYYPNRDFYMANNLIHDIDGDGLIVDNCSNSLVEYNLCYRTAIHLTQGSRAAVGLFNWNSDNTVFQYNEMYGIGLNGTRQDGDTVAENVTAQDGHGIEVDALNDGTWVQYNYSHDNAAFMMLCCYQNIYKSYNSYIRYNISVGDGTNPSTPSHGYFYNGQYAYNTEVYNNIMYMDERTVNSSNQIELLTYPGSVQDVYKFYNNIFYYAGETPATVINWGDSTADYQSNIIYGFTNRPVDDSTENPNIIEDPIFVDPDCGTDGTEAGKICDLGGFKLSENSPAIDKGVILASMSDGKNSGLDFEGNTVYGTPDIGAFENDQYPGAPENVEISDITDSSATVTWTAPKDDSVTGYVIKSGETTVASLKADELSFEFSGLFPGTRYTFCLYSTDGEVLSKVSHITFTTSYTSGSQTEPSGFTLGDVNSDESINAADAIMVLQHYAGIITLDGAPAKNQPVSVYNSSVPTAATENGLIFHEENITVDSEEGISLTEKSYAQEVMAMEQGTFVIRFISTSTNDVQSLISVANADSVSNHFHIYITPAGVIGMESRGGSAGDVRFATEADVLNPTGEENAVAVRYDKDSKTYSVFANGEFLGDFLNLDSFISNIPGLNALTLGKTPRTANSNYVFGGTIASIDVYGTLLTDDELVSATAPKNRNPVNPSASDVTDTNVTVSWEAPNGITDIAGYVIKLDDTTIAEVSSLSCTLTGFDPGTEYTLSIYSKSTSGVLSDAEEVTFKTAGEAPAAGGKPSAPADAAASDITSFGAVITWTASADDDIAGYAVTEGNKTLAYTNPDTLSFTLRSLEPGKEYTVSIYAITSEGTMSEPETVTFTTVPEGIASQFSAADVNRDGKVDAADAILILQYYAGIIEKF